MGFLVRAARRADAEALGLVHVRAWHAAYRGVMPDAYRGGLLPDERAESRARFLELFAGGPRR